MKMIYFVISGIAVLLAQIENAIRKYKLYKSQLKLEKEKQEFYERQKRSYEFRNESYTKKASNNNN